MVPGDERPTKVPATPDLQPIEAAKPVAKPAASSSFCDLKSLLNEVKPVAVPITPSSDESVRDRPWAFGHNDVSGVSPDYANLRETLRDYMFLNAMTTSPSTPAILSGNIFENDLSLDDQLLNLTKGINAFHDGLEFGHGPADHDILSPEENLLLLTRYVNDIGPWLDMFDHRSCFTALLSKTAKDDPLMCAILTISSRQRDKLQHDRPVSETTYRLYERSLTYLIPKVKKVPDTSVMASCVILCCFEMMSSDPSETWTKHLKGCAALFRVADLHGFSGGLRQAVFWCFIRMDVMHAISHKTATLIPCENWLPRNCTVQHARALFLDSKFDGNESRDMYANYMVFLLARVCRLVYSGNLKQDEFESEWIELYTELDRWWQDRPSEMHPVVSVFKDGTPFPSILFCVAPAISGTQMFHTAMILLMKYKTRIVRPLPTLAVDPVMRKSLIWHAKCVVGISLSNSDHGCLNNALQPLWVAGKLMSSKEEQHIIVQLLRDIENTTGWSTSWRIRDLQEHWSY
ncbi:hypothetical protein KL907_003535 [Ogataea polymorpha]|nr:hypothetical protein KL907_003535 [Ogataea polymorpha]